MLIVDLFHLIYVVDFFINEDWYLRTIDMCHDHFGYYLAWGSMVWLPSMYTLQCQYLARYPVDLSTFSAIALTLTGLSGYALFRSVNFQKDLARRTKGNCEIWGKKAEVMKVGFRTKDGERHESLLLISGMIALFLFSHSPIFHVSNEIPAPHSATNPHPLLKPHLAHPSNSTRSLTQSKQAGGESAATPTTSATSCSRTPCAPSAAPTTSSPGPTPSS